MAQTLLYGNLIQSGSIPGTAVSTGSYVPSASYASYALTASYIDTTTMGSSSTVLLTNADLIFYSSF